MPADEGVPIHYGRGIGGLLSGIFRRGVLPLPKTVGNLFSVPEQNMQQVS